MLDGGRPHLIQDISFKTSTDAYIPPKMLSNDFLFFSSSLKDPPAAGNPLVRGAAECHVFQTPTGPLHITARTTQRYDVTPNLSSPIWRDPIARGPQFYDRFLLLLSNIIAAPWTRMYISAQHRVKHKGQPVSLSSLFVLECMQLCGGASSQTGHILQLKKKSFMGPGHQRGGIV